MARPAQIPHLHEERVAWLRQRITAHNRLVLLAGVLTFFVVVGLWYLLFALIYWLVLLFAGVVRGMDSRPPDVLPAVFIYSAGVLLLITWAARRRLDPPLPPDEKTVVDIVRDFVFALPRMTLDLWGSLAAWQRLNDRQLELAAILLERLATEGRVSMYQLPLEIPGEKDRERILLALQISDILRFHRVEAEAWISLATTPDDRAKISPPRTPGKDEPPRISRL